MDIKILFKTVETVLKHDNVYTNAEGQASAAQTDVVYNAEEQKEIDERTSFQYGGKETEES